MSPKAAASARALVLERFNQPFVLREFDLPEPGSGEVLAKVRAAGVCGSDLHEHAGRDPRTPLPIIPGHEGIGEAVAVGEGATLHDGRELKPGMPIVWERGLTCGKCYWCLRNQRYLCVERKVYGINISCAEPPHLSGNYATHILLRKGTLIYPLEASIDPAVLVAATCSGATAAHAHEYARIAGGETVVVYGSGPLAAFQIAFALDSGAESVIVVTRSPGPKADIARAFGADELLYRAELNSDDIIHHLLNRTNGIGVDVAIDTTPDPSVFREAMGSLRRGGVYVNPGLSIPSRPAQIELFSDLVSRNLTIHGVWASDASHLQSAVRLVLSGKFPFDRLVTHRFPLEQHEEAWDVLRNRSGMKIVFEP